MGRELKAVKYLKYNFLKNKKNRTSVGTCNESTMRSLCLQV